MYVQAVIFCLLFNVVLGGFNGLRADQGNQLTNRRQLPGSTAALNAALSTINLDIPLGDIEELQVNPNIFANVGETAAVSGISIGDIVVTGTRLNQQQYEIKLEIVDFEFTGVTSVSFRCTGFFTFFCPSDGTVTLNSEAPSQATTITISKIVTSSDLDTVLPTEVIDDSTCNDIVNLDNVGLVVSDVTVLFINIGDLATDLINEPATREEALGPLRNTLCEQLLNISNAFGDLLINNPISDIIPNPIVPFDTLVAQAQATVVPGPGQDVFNLEDFDIVEILRDLLGNFTDIGDIIDVIAPIVGLNASSAVDLIADFLDSLNITQILSDGIELLDIISETIDLGELGSVDINVTAVRVAVDLPAEVLVGDASALQQIFQLPTINVDELRAGVDVSLDVTISATDLLLPGVSIILNIVEDFSVALTIADIVAKIAVLFALDLNALPGALDFQIGALYEAAIQCLLSLFVVPPSLITEFSASSIALAFTNVDDVLVNAVAALAQALLDIYGWALPAALGALLNSLSDTLFGDTMAGCPQVVDGPDGALPYDFTQDPVLTLVNQVLGINLGDAAGPILDTVEGLDLSIINSELTVGTINIPNTNRALQIKLNSLALEDIFPIMIEEFHILNPAVTSTFAPQGLQSSIDIESSAVIKAIAQLNIISQVDGSVIDGNLFDASVGLASASAAAEIWATLTNFEVLGRSLRELVNIPCLIADLDPFGGLKTANINLNGLALNFTCQVCDTIELVELDAVRLAELKAAVLQDVTDLTNAAVALFDNAQFAGTITAATNACAGQGSAGDIFAGVLAVVTNTLNEYLDIIAGL